MKVFGAAFAAAILLFGGAAQAQSGSPEAEEGIRLTDDGAWRLVRTREGCGFIISGFHALDGMEDLVFTQITRQWTGNCGGGGLASGAGTLTTEFRRIAGSESVMMREELQGTASGGLWEGEVTKTFYLDEGSGMHTITYGDGSISRSTDTFVAGCMSWETDYCDRAAGRRASAAVRARGAASYFGGGASGSGQLAEGLGGAAPTGGRVTAVATPAAGAGRKPFLNSCLLLKAPEGDREPGSWGANVWTIQNSCQTKLYVTWCADEDSREALRNICANKAAVTNELLAGGTIIFQSVARELSIQAFACRAPDFPQDAGFTEDRRLTASGCP